MRSSVIERTKAIASISSSPDPVAALREAWRRARQLLSFTSVRGRQQTSTHHLHIGGYSTVRTLYKHGEGVPSKPFRAGGHRWKLTYYPNGHAASTTGLPSVLLSLMENRFFGKAADATAAHTVSVLCSDGGLLYSRSVEPHKYSPHSRLSWRPKGVWMDVMDASTAEETKEVLRRLKDDIMTALLSGVSSRFKGRRWSPTSGGSFEDA